MSKLVETLSSFVPFSKRNSSIQVRRTRARRPAASQISIALAACGALFAAPASAEENSVRIWNQRAVVTLTNASNAGTPGAGFSPPVALIHMAIVQGAVYDAVNAIKGGHDPYIPGLKAPTSTSTNAAAATAAYHVLSGLIDQIPGPNLSDAARFSIKARLYQEYVDSLAGVREGPARDKGIEVGAAAAAAMMASRIGDGRFGAGGFPVSNAPGGWRPVGPTFGNDPNGWVRAVRPFTLPASEYFHTPGPWALTSEQYAADYNEVKAVGSVGSATRTGAQTALAQWSAPHPVPMTSGALRQLASLKGLTVAQEARFYAMTSMTGADAAINCFAEKAHWGFWRPTTAIAEADLDGNPATAPEANWTSLLPVPPYSDEPSGANCVYASIMTSAKLFFGTDVVPEFTISNAVASRPYTRFSDVIKDVIDARVYGGLHFRRADLNGADLGKKVAEYVDQNYFNCGPPGQCRQERLH